MGNDSFQETGLVDDAVQSIMALLPESWSLDAGKEVLSVGQVDLAVELVGPGGDRVEFAAQAKRSGSMPTATLLSTLRDLERRTQSRVLLLSDYVGPTLRTALEGEGMNYADATGWVRLTSDDPLILVTGQGAAKSPRLRRASAVARLNGVAANRTIRALVTARPPIGVRELADLAGVAPGSVSKLLVTLAAEGVVDRDVRGGVAAVQPRALVEMWARDYAFSTTNKPVGYYIAPRGLEGTLTRLGQLDTEVALTGSAAARRLLRPGVTSVVPLRLLAIYADALNGLARELRLTEADPVTANVVIAAPQDRKILAKPGEDVPLAPPALVLADLLTLPSRSDAEAQQLMDSLARDDAQWSN